MELGVARDECRKMISKLRAFEAVDKVLEQAEMALAQVAMADKMIAELGEKREKAEEVYDKAMLRRDNMIRQAEHVEKEHDVKITDLNRQWIDYKKKIADKVAKIEVDAAAKEAELDAVIKGKLEMVKMIEADIKKAQTRLAEAQTKYEEFKRKL